MSIPQVPTELRAAIESDRMLLEQGQALFEEPVAQAKATQAAAEELAIQAQTDRIVHDPIQAESDLVEAEERLAWTDGLQSALEEIEAASETYLAGPQKNYKR